MPASVVLLFCLGAALIALLVGFRVHLTRSREGKMLAFVALFALPVMAAWAGFSEQMDRAESTKFCLSCHVMDDFGRSLLYRRSQLYSGAPTSRTTAFRAITPATPATPNYTMFGTRESQDARAAASVGAVRRRRSQTGSHQAVRPFQQPRVPPLPPGSAPF